MKGVEDALGRLEGVQRVQIDLQRNLVTITPERRRSLDLLAIPSAIQGAGFKPEGLTVVASGTIEWLGPQETFRITGWRKTHPLEGVVPVNPGPVTLVLEVLGREGKTVLRVLKPS